ncbi:filamentous hemagglutinin N-terminal domain-containing protein [Nostoc sphaeroides]|uniref:two-partner secretion domain-containing protein n=1 Tax=Nostoc sphaeroides TaxID=446679 RepID=UPI0018832296|nr:filamentous hemagglutinin N-terminal domain-containing protein [Nostoc sphaeroides]
MPDNTLGRENSVVTPNANVRGLPATLLQGGAIRGVNLFQSFLKFNVGDGDRVYFSNPAGIQNILSRITGGDPSKIFGTLGVDGKANLFFLNPNGIIFGPNARLDVAGSFFASTANSFVFENGLQFSATNPEAPPLITVNIRPGLQLGGDRSGTISSRANLNAGEDLALSGVKLDLQGKLEAGRDLTLQATDTVKIRDRVTNPFIASAGRKLVVQGNQNVDIFALNNPNSGFFSGGDILLRSASTIGGDAHYWAGGNFRIEQLDGNLGNLFSPYDPVIRASGDVSFDNYTGASLHILAGGSVNIGTVDITGADPTNGLVQDAVPLSDGTSLKIDGKTQATLDIRAGTNDFDPLGLVPANFPGPNPPNVGSGISNQTQTAGANITIGGINVAPGGQIFLTNKYQPNPNIPGGSINITGVSPDTRNDSFPFSITAFGSQVTLDSRGDIQIAKGVITGVGRGLLKGGDIKIISGGTVQLNPAGLPGQFRGSLVSKSNGDSGNITVTAAKNIIATGNITSQVVPGSSGKGGDISLKSNSGEIDTSRITITSQSSDGRAGDINIEAGGDIRLGDVEASSNNDDVEASSNNNDDTDTGFSKITIQSNQGSVFLDNSRLSTSNSGSASAGNISITAANNVSIINSNYDDTTPEDNKKGIFSEGNLGRIFIGESSSYASFSPKTVEINNSRLSTTNVVSGNTIPVPNENIRSGDISIRAIEQISLNENSQLDTETGRKGNAGSVLLETSNGAISLDNSSISGDVKSGSEGNGGGITVNTGSLFLNNASINANTSGINPNSNKGSFAGDITINAVGGAVNVENGSFISAQILPGGNGTAGNININAASFLLSNASQVNAFVNDTFNNQNNVLPVIGKAGDININVGNGDFTIQGSPDGSGITGIFNTLGNGAAEARKGIAQGRGGNLTITSGQFSIIGTNTTGEANAGIAAKSFGVGVPGNTELNGDAGNIEINTGTFSINNGGFIDNSTTNQGNAGYIKITAGDSIAIANDNPNRRAIQSVVQPGSEKGNGGNITLDTNLFSLNNASISTSTFGNGNAGSVTITANDFEALNGGQIQTNTSTNGNAGNIELKIKDNITLSGARTSTNPESDRQSYYLDENKLIPSGLFATTQEDSTGNGGNILIDPNLVTIKDSARIAVDSKGSGNAGTITLNANRLILDNQGKITGDTFSGTGGAITLNLRDLLLLRRNSLISTTAGVEGAGGNGGDITITSLDNSKPFPFIVAVNGENSDIIANAQTGAGGRININTSGVFGIATLSREQLGNRSPGNLSSNDITAISEQGSPALDGQVNINSPDVDLTNDLVSLPENPVDASKLIAQGCGNFVAKGSEFINAGRGGLPPSPDSFTSGNAVWNDTRLTVIPTNQKIPNAGIVSSDKSALAPIIPATGWVFNNKGDVTLISHTSGANSNSSLFSSNSSSCRIP